MAGMLEALKKEIYKIMNQVPPTAQGIMLMKMHGRCLSIKI